MMEPMGMERKNGAKKQNVTIPTLFFIRMMALFRRVNTDLRLMGLPSNASCFAFFRRLCMLRLLKKSAAK